MNWFATNVTQTPPSLEESAEILKQSEHAEHLESELAATKKELAARDAALHAERARIQAVTESLSRFDEIQGQHKDLELLLDLFLKRNKNLEDENAKLVQHNNHKQKLQYHLQIKQGMCRSGGSV